MRDVAIGSGIGLSLVAAIVFGDLLNATAFGILALPLAILLPLVVISSAYTSSRQRRSHGQLPPGQGNRAPEAQQPSQPRQTEGAQVPRGIRPVPGAM